MTSGLNGHMPASQKPFTMVDILVEDSHTSGKPAIPIVQPIQDFKSLNTSLHRFFPQTDFKGLKKPRPKAESNETNAEGDSTKGYCFPCKI